VIVIRNSPRTQNLPRTKGAAPLATAEA